MSNIPENRISQDSKLLKIKQPKIHSPEKMVLQDSFPYAFRLIIKFMLLFKYENWMTPKIARTGSPHPLKNVRKFVQPAQK